MEAIIPEIDFQKLSLEKEEWLKLRDACEKIGCFRLINHPIPPTLMADMKLVAKHLHELPKEIKMLNKSVIPESGYLSSEVSPLYEGLGIYDMLSSPNAFEEFCSQLNVSPHNRKTLEAYGQAIHNLASTMSQKLAECLGIMDSDFKDWPFIFRIMKYDFSPKAIGTLGAYLHSDTGFMTLLQDDEVISGLELMDDSNSFKSVPPKSGSFLCIVGDVGHAWSNGRFWNVRHRVVCKETSTRYSFGAFIMAPRDGVVETPEELVDTDHPRLYRSFHLEDLRNFRKTMGKRSGEVFDQFRLVK